MHFRSYLRWLEIGSTDEVYQDDGRLILIIVGSQLQNKFL